MVSSLNKLVKSGVFVYDHPKKLKGLGTIFLGLDEPFGPITSIINIPIQTLVPLTYQVKLEQAKLVFGSDLDTRTLLHNYNLVVLTRVSNSSYFYIGDVMGVNLSKDTDIVGRIKLVLITIPIAFGNQTGNLVCFQKPGVMTPKRDKALKLISHYTRPGGFKLV